MPNAFTRFTRRAILTSLAVLGTGAAASADVVATFTGNSQAQTLTVTASNAGHGPTTYNGVPVGPFDFTATNTGGTGLSTNFHSFCADFFQFVTPNTQYTFTPGSASTLPDVGTNSLRGTRIQNLFDKFFGVATDAEKGGAFQLALWELLYDGGSAGPLSLTSGNFSAGGSGTSLGVAQGWLDNIDTPAAGGNQYQLIGLYSSSAQDQLTAIPSTPSPVPAPAGAILLGIGAVALVVRRRFTVKKAEVQA